MPQVQSLGIARTIGIEKGNPGNGFKILARGDAFRRDMVYGAREKWAHSAGFGRGRGRRWGWGLGRGDDFRRRRGNLNDSRGLKMGRERGKTNKGITHNSPSRHYPKLRPAQSQRELPLGLAHPGLLRPEDHELPIPLVTKPFPPKYLEGHIPLTSTFRARVKGLRREDQGPRAGSNPGEMPGSRGIHPGVPKPAYIAFGLARAAEGCRINLGS
jgi:hypothetical protein